MRKFFNNRYAPAYSFIILFLTLSFLVRLTLVILSWSKAFFSVLSFPEIFFKGIVYDLGVAFFFCVLYSIYLLVIPSGWNRSVWNRTLTYTGFFLAVLIIMFSFFAEFAFWEEFESRFNFIAVDYLVYTYEVIHNINESYPLPLLISAMIGLSLSITLAIYRMGVFERSYVSSTSFTRRLIITTVVISVSVCYILFVKNSWAENSQSRYQNELSKAGIYSFFAAFKSNELNYRDFYKLIDDRKAFDLLRTTLKDSNTVFCSNGFSLRRKITHSGNPVYPNVIMLTIESLSAEFLKHFGNTEHITPVLDSLADNSIFFTNLYATGNRTVRGMEALTLSIPPTPGNSIVRRENNDNLVTSGSVFKKAGYDCGFFYGGDGYFDNMNNFFGNNGFDVTDRGKHVLEVDDLHAKHHHIPDKTVHFENAWGICDQDLYDAVTRDADAKYASGKPFYDFVMTTSNHRPYTYPLGKIDIPPGSRAGAVKYTDWAIGEFLNSLKGKPWFQNTIIILVADHCANSAGKNEVDISKYNIPCWILNLPVAQNTSVTKMCSQIDIYPTLFGLLGWNYESNFFGQNVFSAGYHPRIFCGTYQKLAFMKDDSLVILGPQKSVQTFLYNKITNTQTPVNFNSLINEAIAPYQAAYYLFKNNGLKQ